MEKIQKKVRSPGFKPLGSVPLDRLITGPFAKSLLALAITFHSFWEEAVYLKP
jgi:hypothetical protein